MNILHAKECPSLVFATNNEHKLSEIRAIFANTLHILSLADIDCHDDIPETADTLEGNALIKARWVKEKYGYDCFADDTGLEVCALGGRPGVHTARYAFPDRHDPEANTQKLLAELKDKNDRSAQFRTAIALIKDGEEHVFEGWYEARLPQRNVVTRDSATIPWLYPKIRDEPLPSSAQR